jgi:hypothetical protein
MAQPIAQQGSGSTSNHATDHTLEHMVEELEEMEGSKAKGSWVRWAVLAFSVVLVTAVVVWTFRTPAGGKLGVPVLGEGVQMSVTTPTYGKLTEPPKVFAWQSVTGRDHYVLAIGTFPGQADVLQKKVTQDRVELTDDEVAKFSASKPYWWSVKAVGKDGKVLGHAESKFTM